MVKCRDILQMNLDGMWLLAGDFALCSVDFEHFGWKEVSDAMRELDELKISGFAISIKDEREEVPEDVIELAEKLTLPPDEKHLYSWQAISESAGLWQKLSGGKEPDLQKRCLSEFTAEKGHKQQYDGYNHTNLIETFLTYYQNGFNISKTASAMYIHRNTLQYRLGKISELLHLELDNYMECLEIINCIMVWKLMFS